LGLPDLAIQQIAFRLLALLMIAGIQGGAVAAAAILLGDKGPRYDGRLTVAPTAHLDLVGAVSVVLFGLGWTRPVDVDASQFRAGRVGIVAVVLAGCLALIALAAILAALILPALETLPYSYGLTTAAFLRSASSLSIWIALFSLVPIPPLTGGLVPGAFGVRVPGRARWILVVVLLAAIWSGVARAALAPVHAALAWIILGG
jgi:hypothetical protein